MRERDDRLNNVAERLREQFNTAILAARNSNTNVGGERYFQRCTTKCELQPGYSGKTQQELDAIAIDMTNQIISDLRTGKITRTQVNQPNWYEHRVAEKLAELERHNQQNFQQFQQSNQEINQQQEQGNTFRTHAVYPGRDWQVTVDQQNCTTDTGFPLQNQLNQRIDKQSELVVQEHGATVPVYGRSYFKQNNFQENRHSSSTGAVVQPIISSPRYHHTSIVERNETRRVPPIVVSLPTQNTYSEVKEEHREQHQTAPVRPIYSGGSRTQQRTRSDFYQSEVVPNYRPHVVVDNSVFKELEVHNHVKTTNHVPVPPPITTTTVTKEEKTVTQNNQQHPVIYLPNRVSSLTNEEHHEEKKVEQRPVYRPTETVSTIKHEEEHVRNQVQHRPIYRPFEHRSTQHVVDESTHETRTNQLPVFSHHSFSQVEDWNETNSQQQVHHGFIPGGQKVSTVKESTFVQISPQIYTHYITELTEEEYLERLQRTQQELQRLGYGVLTEREYNATIDAGGFVHNGFRYLYNVDTGRYEQSSRSEVSTQEYRSQLRLLQEQLARYGFSQMTEEEFNETITSGTFIRNGEQYRYDLNTGYISKYDLTEREYHRRYDRLQQELIRLGLRELTETEFNQTITNNYILIDGVSYTFNTATGRLEREHRVDEVDIAEHEYRTTLRRLQELLTRLGLNQMTEREYNETIRTGEFFRGGNRYRLNTYSGNYERVELTESEYTVILNRLRDTLSRLNYRLMTQKEYNETISTGNFIRGGYQWSYNAETGETNRVRVADQFEELLEEEYRLISNNLDKTLLENGYERMSISDRNTTIISGQFTRGGITWVYQPDSFQFERVELSAEEFQFRLARLVEVLTRLQIQKDQQEMHNIVNRGNFYHASHRYEYSIQSKTFERIELSEEEYRERLRRLLIQLADIGHTMTETQCRETIEIGVFYYGGYEWVYNNNSGWYDRGARSDKEPGISNIPSTIDYDNTKYDTTQQKKNETASTTSNHRDRKPEEISKGRGDQPPPTFVEDYEESEELPVEPEPGITPAPRPRPRPTQAQLPPPVTVPIYPSHEQHERYERKRTENLVSVAVPIPTQQTQYKKSYHRKETVYTQTGGAVVN